MVDTFELTNYNFYSSRLDMELITSIVDTLKEILEEDKKQEQPLFLKVADNFIMDIDIKEEVYKCSKCGLCQSVCPIYLATKNEMYLSRGRYIVLNNSYNYNKKLSTKFIK